MGGKLGDGRQYFPWIHLSDAIGILIHLIEATAIRGPVNGVAPEPVTNTEFTAALGRTLSRPVALRVPAFALKLALGQMAEELLLASQRVSPIRLLETGYAYKFPLLEPALADLLHPFAGTPDAQL